jgi:hypothetical protein
VAARSFVKSLPAWQEPATLFLLLASVLGVLYLILTPPLRAPDERHHLRRIVQITAGGVIDAAPIPRGVQELFAAGKLTGRGLRHRRDIPFSGDDFGRLAAIRLGADDPVPFAGDRTLAYSPLPYLPAIPVVSIGLRAGLRPLGLLYASRASLLVAGVLLLALAIRLVPDLAWPLCLIALLPTVSFLRSCVSADTLTTAFAFLAFAQILRLRAASTPLHAGDLILLAVATSGLALAKVAYLPLTLAALPMLLDRLGQRRGGRAVAAVVALLPWLVGMAWLWALGGNVAVGDLSRARPDAQLALVLHEPSHFVHAFVGSWLTPSSLANLSQAVVGRFLLLNLRIPWPFVIVCFGLLALLAAASPARCAPRPRERAVFLLAALACTVVVSLGAYLKWSAFGSASINGIQGRYLIPLIPYVLFALLPPRRLRWAWPGRSVAIAVLATVLASNLWSLIAIVCSTWAAGR